MKNNIQNYLVKTVANISAPSEEAISSTILRVRGGAKKQHDSLRKAKSQVEESLSLNVSKSANGFIHDNSNSEEITSDIIFQTIPCFVSEHVRFYYQDKSSVPDEPICDEKFGAVVMADVSGYSSLASNLAQRGPQGVEILAKTMNSFFEKAVDIVIYFNGDVIKFAGDAIIFCWRTEETDEMIRGEYVFTGLRMLFGAFEEIVAFPHKYPDCAVTELNVHLGVGAGTMFDVQVGGGSGRWEHFIAGDSVSQLGQVLDLAKPGELAVSHRALSYLSKIVHVSSLELGAYDKRCIILNALEKKKRISEQENNAKNMFGKSIDWNDMNLAKCTIYQNYITKSFLERIQCGEILHLAMEEVREVTTMFIKIKAITFKTETCLTKSQSAMDIIQYALKKYEGILRQFIVDDKGSVILCYFGITPYTHQNDQMNAILAGTYIQEEFKNIFNDRFSIGIATGHTFVGLLGNKKRADYTVIGDSAARLMSNPICKKSVICDERTYFLTNNRIQYQDMGKIDVKGKNQPISIFKPLGFNRESKLVYPPNPEIARHLKDAKTIAETVKQFADKQKSVAYITGDEPESLFALAQIMSEEAKKIGFVVLFGSETEKVTPLSSFENFKEQLFLAEKEEFKKSKGNNRPSIMPIKPTALSTSEIANKTIEENYRMQSESKESFALSLSDIHYGKTNFKTNKSISGSSNSGVAIKNEATKDLSDQNFMKINIISMIRNMKNNRALILCYDYQWADIQSWEVLEQVFKNHQDKVYFGIFVSNIHGSAANKFSDIIKSSPLTVSIQTASLTKDEIRKMFSNQVGEDIIIPDYIIEAIFTRAEGHIVYAFNMIKSLLSDNTLSISKQDGLLHCYTGDINLQNFLPVSFRLIVLSQLDNLDQRFQVLLRAASIIGKFFSVDDVIKFGRLKATVEELNGQISVWDKHGYLVRNKEMRNFYSFKSSMVKDTIYSLISITNRMKTHTEIAKDLQSRISYSHGVDIFLPVVYEHYNQTDNAQNKIDVLEKLAQEYAYYADYAQAIEYYRKLQIYGKTQEAQNYFARTDTQVRIVVWMRGEGEILVKAGRVEEAIKKYMEALKLLGVDLMVKNWRQSLYHHFFKEESKFKETKLFRTEHSVCIKSLTLALHLHEKKAMLIDVINYAFTIKNSDVRLQSAISYCATLGRLKQAKRATKYADRAVKCFNSKDRKNEKEVVPVSVQIECLEFLSLVKFATMDFTLFENYSAKLTKLLLNTRSSDKVLDILLLSVTSWLFFGHLDKMHLSFETLKWYKMSCGRNRELDIWQFLVQAQLMLPTGSFNQAGKIITAVHRSLENIDPTLVSSAEMLLVDSIEFYMSAVLNPAKTDIVIFLENAASTMKFMDEKNNYRLLLPIFHNLRAIIRIYDFDPQIINISKDILISYSDQVKVILNAQSMFKIASSLWILHDYVLMKIKGREKEALEHLIKGYNVKKSVNSMKYIDGFIMSILAKQTPEVLKSIKKLPRTDPLAAAAMIFSSIGSLHDLNMLNISDTTLGGTVKMKMLPKMEDFQGENKFSSLFEAANSAPKAASNDIHASMQR